MLWLILLAYVVVGYFYPIAGWIALICMVGPVLMSVYRGRYWCGNICPRGSLYTNIISRISLNKHIPPTIRSNKFRYFMIAFIMTMFVVQFYFAWGNWSAMGNVFWRLIVVTTIVGIALGIIYSPRAWCTFCPMGTLSAIATKHSAKSQRWNKKITLGCKNCGLCARRCPMQLTPAEAVGSDSGYNNIDCLRCDQCKKACPAKVIN